LTGYQVTITLFADRNSTSNSFAGIPLGKSTAANSVLYAPYLSLPISNPPKKKLPTWAALAVAKIEAPIKLMNIVFIVFIL
jgi:hypothetical protein